MLVLDTHLDAPANFVKPGWNVADRHSFDADGSQVDLPRMIEGGLDGGFWAIYTGQGPRTPEGFAAARDTALLRALSIHQIVARYPQQLRAGAHVRRCRAHRGAGQTRGVPEHRERLSARARPDAAAYVPFARRAVGRPGAFRNNDLADSATDPAKEWNGLSPLGKQLVVEANRLGIVLDASHASDDVLDQLIELSRTPVLLSHSAARRCSTILATSMTIGCASWRRAAA